MADTDGIPVIGGLFKIAKAPFKLLGGVGETGLGILNADGTQIGNGLKGTWNSIWDVPEGAFGTVKDIAGAGEIFSSDVHFDEKGKVQAQPKRLPPKGQVPPPPPHAGHVPPQPPTPPAPPVKRAPEGKAPSAPKAQVPQKPASPVKPPKAQVVPPENKAPKTQAEPPKTVVVPPENKEPKAQTEPPKENNIPKDNNTPKLEAAPKAKDAPKDTQKQEKKGIFASIADFFSRGTKGEKILKYSLTTIGIIAGALILKKGASSLFKLFAKNKAKDPMIKPAELYQALTGKRTLGTVPASSRPDPMISSFDIAQAMKGKHLEPKFGHRVTPQHEIKLLEYKPTIAKTPTVQPTPVKPTPAPVVPAPEPKLPPQITPEDILAGKFAQTGKVPPQVTPQDILKPLQPKIVAKSGVVKADEYAKLADKERPVLIRTINDDEAISLAEKAKRKQYLKKVMAEVKAQAKARAKKLAKNQ